MERPRKNRELDANLCWLQDNDNSENIMGDTIMLGIPLTLGLDSANQIIFYFWKIRLHETDTVQFGCILLY